MRPSASIRAMAAAQPTREIHPHETGSHVPPTTYPQRVRDLRSLPKVDLHVHLQGSVRPSTVLELAARNGVDVPPKLTPDGYATWDDFPDFIANYIRTCAAIRTPDDLRRIAIEFCEDASTQGVRYAEVTFTVLGHDIDGDWNAPVAAVLDGFEEGEDRFGTRCRLVLDFVRGWHGTEAETRTLQAALTFRDRGVVAVGLGGDESRPGAGYADAIRHATGAGLHSVPHAGEAAGRASIREALDLLGAERLGHGFRVLDDAALVDEIRERGITLEVCPTSNVATGLVRSLDEHPLPHLLEAGLAVTINSDDPAMFRSPLLGEYEAARTVFGFDDTRLAGLARTAVRSSFADDMLKAQLTAEIEDWLR